MTFQPHIQPHHQTNKRIPHVRREYSAGFRNLGLSAYTQTIQQPKYIDTYIEQIGVKNLADLYRHQKQQQVRRLDDRSQKQRQSDIRLYKNIYPKKQKEEENIPAEPHDQNDKYASDIWSNDPKFQHQALQLFHTKKLINKVYHQLHSVYTNQYKHKQKLLKPPHPFVSMFIGFLVSEVSELVSQKFKAKSQDGYEEQIVTIFRYHLCQHKITILKKKYKSLVLSLEQMCQLKQSSRFLFCVISELQAKFKEQKTQFPYSVLQSQVKNINVEKWAQRIIESGLFRSLIKDFTKPFEIGFNTNNDNKKQELIDDYDSFLFKAKPIPKTTYQEPKTKQRERPKSSAAKPFNLSENKPKKVFEDYYYWDTSFKANPIPETTYKPEQIKLLSEQQKKAQAFLLLKQAAYPQTMEYLTNYNEFTNHKKQEISHKHQKKQISIERHQVPNFQYLHAKEMVLLQNTKQRNRHDIKQKPFNLSTNKPKKSEAVQIINVPEHRPVPNMLRKPQIESKSTKKFDTYVEKRKLREQHEKQKIMKKEEQEKNRKKKMEKYKGVLKERMAYQLRSHPLEHPPYEPNRSMKVRVDFNKIYREQPLLMESSLPQVQYNLPWKTIFEDK